MDEIEQFKPVKDLRFDIVDEKDNGESYQLKFHNYKTDTDVEILNVSRNIVETLTRESIYIRDNCIFNIIPSQTIYDNLVRMVFLDIGYGAEVLPKGESYKNSYSAFASTIYATFELYNNTCLFKEDPDSINEFKEAYDKFKAKYLPKTKSVLKSTI